MSDPSKVFDRVTALISNGRAGLGHHLGGCGAAPAVGAAGVARATAEVELTEFSIRGELAVPVGQVSLRVTDQGTVAHNLAVVDGPSNPDFNPGESSALNLGDLSSGTDRLLCTVPGHEAAKHARLSDGRGG